MKRLVPILVIASLTIAAAPAKLSEAQRAQHALNRLAFGPRPGDVERVTAMGVDRWIEQQLHPERIDDRAVDARLAQYETLSMSSAQIAKEFYAPIVEARRAAKAQDSQPDMRRNIDAARRPKRVMEELQSQRIIRAAESQRQLEEVLVDFWMNHFNVFAGKGADRFLLTGYERDTIRPRVFGNFEELLRATAKSPAMLFYLDNARSVNGRINENYARELMELHTLGVDGGYTQKDVTELARVFSGWSIERPQQGGGFVFRPRLHDRGPKTVLGIHFAAGGGQEEGERMLSFLAHQPNTAKHIARKLCQRFVADEPPPALVDRVAKTFLATNGDLRATVKSVIDSREFWDPSSYRAKVKSPFEYAISAVRAVDAHITTPLPLARALQQAGEPLYGAQPPTGYSDAAEAWVNTGALMARLNFALALTANRLPGVEANVIALVPHDDAMDGAHAADALARALTGGELSQSTRATIAQRTTGAWDEAQLRTVAGLIVGSPEFQRQ